MASAPKWGKNDNYSMKVAGFLLLLAGWLIVVAAVVLFAIAPLRPLFVLLGGGVEALGLILVVQSHRARREGSL